MRGLERTLRPAAGRAVHPKPLAGSGPLVQLLVTRFGVNLLPARVASLLTAVTVTWLLNRRFTFRVTARPAQYLGLAGEIGTLAPGACADLSVLRWNDQAPPLQDVDGIERPGGCWEPVLTVRAGKVV